MTSASSIGRQTRSCGRGAVIPVPFRHKGVQTAARPARRRPRPGGGAMARMLGGPLMHSIG